MKETYNFYKIFKPELSPKQMLAYSVFEGSYLGDTIHEYPKSWFTKAKLSKTFDADLNYFQIRAGLSLKKWTKRGWIMKEDPRGWFQWYCRYSNGRRIPKIDNIQIARWKVFGPRHIGGIKKIALKNSSIAEKNKGKPYYNGPIILFFNKD